MKNTELATFGGGCFWCIEAIIQRLKGVTSLISGYSAGDTIDPDYKSICTGTTGHAEVIQVEFDPETLPYEDLITIFMTSHDPTTLNRQGGDKGTQYRSIILYHNETQKVLAQKVLDRLSTTFTDKIVTEIKELDIFYPAETGHQDYYKNNSSAGYCQVVIAPKITKLRAQYADRLKTDT